jgi:hypothetical protein
MSTYKVQDNSANGVGTVVQLLQHFFPYAQKQLGFHKPVMISFDSDEDNASKLLGRTGQYNPDDFSISIYVDSRHPKDILRSLSHELVHHTQNCNGDFASTADLSQGYAQENGAMRDAELDAYKRGNIIFRDFEDLIKKGTIKVNINFEETGEPKMSLKEWKSNELNTLLMKKWGLLKESKEVSESFASERGGEATFFADEPGAWGEADPEDQPELNFIFSAAKPEVKEKFMLIAADLLQAYDSASRSGDPRAESLLDRIKRAWLQFSKTGNMGELEEVSYRKEQQRPSKPEEHEDLEEGLPTYRSEDDEENVKESLTLDEARDLARRIFEKISKEIQ